jgi:hypothetical protein
MIHSRDLLDCDIVNYHPSPDIPPAMVTTNSSAEPDGATGSLKTKQGDDSRQVA